MITSVCEITFNLYVKHIQLKPFMKFCFLFGMVHKWQIGTMTLTHNNIIVHVIVGPMAMTMYVLILISDTCIKKVVWYNIFNKLTTIIAYIIYQLIPFVLVCKSFHA